MNASRHHERFHGSSSRGVVLEGGGRLRAHLGHPMLTHFELSPALLFQVLLLAAHRKHGVYWLAGTRSSGH